MQHIKRALTLILCHNQIHKHRKRKRRGPRHSRHSLSCVDRGVAIGTTAAKLRTIEPASMLCLSGTMGPASSRECENGPHQAEHTGYNSSEGQAAQRSARSCACQPQKPLRTVQGTTPGHNSAPSSKKAMRNYISSAMPSNRIPCTLSKMQGRARKHTKPRPAHADGGSWSARSAMTQS
jgi:hypothetical protein